MPFECSVAKSFTYADRDAKRRWATGMAASGVLGQIGGLGGSLVGGLCEFELQTVDEPSSLWLTLRSPDAPPVTVRSGASKILG